MAQSVTMPSELDIAAQCERLVQYRQNVQLMLRQIGAQGGWIYAPIALLNGLSDNRREIARCKATLRSWQVLVDDQPDDDAASDIARLDQQVAKLKASRVALPALVRQAVEQVLAGVQERRETLKQIEGTVSISGGSSVHGAVLGVNQGTVQVFFGGQPPENGATLLDAYLDGLSRECQHLRLSRLTGKHQNGADQRADPPLRLQTVYTSLTTDGTKVVVGQHNTTVAEARKALMQERTPEQVPPEQVRLVKVNTDELLGLHKRGIAVLFDLDLLEQHPLNTTCTLRITRAELALEAIARQRRLVLLGEPGAGKSTVLRYLALLLAQRLCGGTPLPGWPADDLPVPILCPLGRVAAALPKHNGNADQALKQVLGELLEGEQGQCEGLQAHLKPALRGTGVLLLFDGLDELPAEASSGGSSPRASIAQAIRNLERWTNARIVVTSRVLPYHAPGDWQLAASEGWEVRTLVPLAFGQVRTFVTSWYAALAATGSDPELDSGRAQARAKALIAELEASPNLRLLVASPLLLTMLAILHYNTDEVPRDRARLYEECVQLLLERWEPVRTPGLRRPGLLERLGNLPGLELDLLRGAIHELAFQAHDQPPGDDGRGVIDGYALYGRMLRLFAGVRSSDPARAVATFEQVLREDAGLLQARDDRNYSFPHLTFQEYLAACYLADLPGMVEEVQQRWHDPDAERWRVVLRLLIGRLRQQGKLHDKLLPWLLGLIASRQGIQFKPAPVRRRDAALAVLVYEEMDAATLANSRLDVEVQLQSPLRMALRDLLAEYDPTISTAERVRVGFLLAALGDPRFPVSLEQWRDALVKMQAGDTSGYFCRLEAGTYWVGSPDNDSEGSEAERPRHQITFEQPFWIGRFPITNAQWQVWVDAGGQASRYADDNNLNHPNQPVVGISWTMAVAFCSWLSQQMGVTMRLPHEVEWEAAARGQEGRYYPWGDAWSKDRAATKEDRETHGWAWTVPVGCYPAGAAACGALDMAGNVWEWTADKWQSYPGTKTPFREENGRVERGGSYLYGRNSVRCGTRLRDHLDFRHHNVGFRVLISPERAEQ